MDGPADPRNPDQLRAGLSAADQQAEGDVGQVCATCPDNWVEAGAVDETTGQPLPGLGYRIYDIATGDKVASGTLDDEGKSPRHNIPMPVTQLYAVFGTEEAMDEAEAKIGDLRREHALQENAVSEWRGIPSGLSRDAFDQQIWERARSGDAIFADKGFLGGAGRGGKGIARLPGAIGEAIFGDGIKAAAEQYYEPYIDEAWDQYQVATGARAATGGESFMGAIPQGATLGFDEEIGARLSSLFDKRSYEELVEGQRQILRQQQISNPGAFMGGEIVGSVPTIFVPVGGAAANAARAGRGVRGAARSGAAAGAGFGAVSGAGHDEGGFVDRLDGAAIGAATGGLGGAILSGAGVLIARGVAKTRIWGKITGRPRLGSLDNKAAREWYLEQERLIPERIDPNAPLEIQARQAHALRNEARTTARELMADRNLASQLVRDSPNLSWGEIIEKTRAKGFQGDDIYREIVSSSQRSRKSVNEKLGL